MSQLNETDLPLKPGEWRNLVIEVAARILLGSVTESGLFAIYPDEAVNLASSMVGYAMSDDVATRTMGACADPATVARSIDLQMDIISKRAQSFATGSTERSAATYAKAFGLLPHDPH